MKVRKPRMAHAVMTTAALRFWVTAVQLEDTTLTTISLPTL